MSFSFDFTSATPQAARARLDQQHVPDCVRMFLEMAIEGIASHHQSDATPFLVHVKADGHLCEDGTSYERSNATIIVEPIFVT